MSKKEKYKKIQPQGNAPRSGLKLQEGWLSQKRLHSRPGAPRSQPRPRPGILLRGGVEGVVELMDFFSGCIDLDVKAKERWVAHLLLSIP